MNTTVLASHLTKHSQSSFGFGQVGGTVLVLHPRFLLGALDPSVYAKYKIENRSRALLSYKAMSEMMITNSLVRIKDSPPYTPELENKVLLNSMARATYDAKNRNYSFTKLSSKVEHDVSNVKLVEQALASSGAVGVGVDQGASRLSLS